METFKSDSPRFEEAVAAAVAAAFAEAEAKAAAKAEALAEAERLREEALAAEEAAKARAAKSQRRQALATVAWVATVVGSTVLRAATAAAEDDFENETSALRAEVAQLREELRKARKARKEGVSPLKAKRLWGVTSL
jgi:hypothetical protein